MTICIEKLDLCLEIPGATAAREAMSERNRLTQAAFLPSDPEELLDQNRQKAWTYMVQ